MNEFKHKLMKQNAQEKIKLHKKGKQRVALTAFSIVGLGAIGLSTTASADETTNAPVSISSTYNMFDDNVNANLDSNVDGDIYVTPEDENLNAGLDKPMDDGIYVTPEEEDVNANLDNTVATGIYVTPENEDLNAGLDKPLDNIYVTPEEGEATTGDDVNAILDNTVDIGIYVTPENEDLNAGLDKPLDNIYVTPEEDVNADVDNTVDSEGNTNIDNNVTVEDNTVAENNDKDSAVKELTNYVNEYYTTNNATSADEKATTSTSTSTSTTEATLPQTGEANEAALASLGLTTAAVAGLAVRRRFAK